MNVDKLNLEYILKKKQKYFYSTIEKNNFEYINKKYNTLEEAKKAGADDYYRIPYVKGHPNNKPHRDRENPVSEHFSPAIEIPKDKKRKAVAIRVAKAKDHIRIERLTRLANWFTMLHEARKQRKAKQVMKGVAKAQERLRKIFSPFNG